MKQYKYSVITCNFGNYEPLREVINPLEDVEYIYVTDDKHLTSNTWNIIYDERYDDYINPFDKVIIFRSIYLNYCHSDICVRIDGSINICGSSFENTINEFNKRNSQISFILSPIISDIETEILGWLCSNRISKEESNEFYNFISSKTHIYDFKQNSICNTGLFIQRNDDLNIKINKKQFDTLEEIKRINNVDHYYRIDQVVFTYVINEYFRDINVLPLHYSHISNEKTYLCCHNTNIPRYEIRVSQSKKQYLFNKVVLSLYDGEKYINLLTKEDIINNSKKIHVSISNAIYDNKSTYESIKNTYNEWIEREDVNVINIENDYYYYKNNSYEKYLTNTTYYKHVLPILCDTLSINYNENDFNTFNYINLDKVYFPKDIKQYLYLIPHLKKESEYYHVYYNVVDSLKTATSFYYFNKEDISDKKIDCGEYSKYTNLVFTPFAIIKNNIKHANDRNLLIFSDGTISPFIPILMQYFSSIFVIDNYLSNFNFDFLYAYENITDILILTSTNKSLNLIIDNI